jgi:hypothetical protein
LTLKCASPMRCKRHARRSKRPTACRLWTGVGAWCACARTGIAWPRQTAKASTGARATRFRLLARKWPKSGSATSSRPSVAQQTLASCAMPARARPPSGPRAPLVPSAAAPASASAPQGSTALRSMVPVPHRAGRASVAPFSPRSAPPRAFHVRKTSAPPRAAAPARKLAANSAQAGHMARGAWSPVSPVRCTRISPARGRASACRALEERARWQREPHAATRAWLCAATAEWLPARHVTTETHSGAMGARPSVKWKMDGHAPTFRPNPLAGVQARRRVAGCPQSARERRTGA